MTEASDRLLAERFAALASPLDDSDWLDVRRRARARRSRAWLAMPLAAVVAAIAVGSALALYRDSIDFWSAPPAPERIVVEYEELRARGKAGLLGFGANVMPGEARRVAFFELDGEERPLFVVPTEDGGFCSRLHFIGTCTRTGPREPTLGAGGLQSKHGGLDWISGRFLDERIRRLELRYLDGTAVPIPFVWVTEPIDAGFYAHDVPDEHEHPDRRPAVIVAFDEDGAELARSELPFDDPRWQTLPDGLPKVADRTQKRTLFDLRDHKGNPWTLVVAPAPEGKLCYAYNFGSGCFSPRFPRSNDQLTLKGGGVVSVCCAVGDDVATVELRYQDGTRTEHKPVEGFLLDVVPPEQYPLGHRLREIVMRDAEGRVVATRDVDPERRAVYPCSKEEELDLGHGVRLCP
jgi:hypothetical protein